MSEIHPYKLKISQLRALVAIADTGSFSDAALQLDLSQSAISHAIATLEDELGVILLNRGRLGAVLTPVGQEITADARSVLQSLESISHKAQLSRGLQNGQVRIAGFRSVATHILPAVIDQFRKKHPGISVTIDELPHYNLVEEELRHGRADVGFTYLPTSADFEAWELLRDRYIVLLPPNATPNAAIIAWDELIQYPLILPPADDCCRQIVSTHINRFGQQLKPAYEVKEDSTIISMVKRGLGATILARLAAEPIPPEIQVVELPIPLERIIGLIIAKDALLPPSVFAFIDTLKEMLPTSQLVQVLSV